MPADFYLLLYSAVAISFLHTLAGPDHYIPFVALSRARGWTLRQTMAWTVVCGLGHIGSSVVLGLAGAALGWSISGLQVFQEVRGGLAGWALLLFGLGYGLWGLRRASRGQVHKHFETFGDGELYVYEHRHGAPAAAAPERHSVTPWVMFLIFLLGPCEPMIPLMFVPAAQTSWFHLSLLLGIYALITLLTMVLLVWAGYFGWGLFSAQKLEKYMHALGGLTIFICGFGMVVLEW